MDEEMFVPEGGGHEGHRVRVAGRGLIKTGMQGDPPEPVTLRDQAVLYCSCGDVWTFDGKVDYKDVIKGMPKKL
jgi:hypothetical protein